MTFEEYKQWVKARLNLNLARIDDAGPKLQIDRADGSHVYPSQRVLLLAGLGLATEAGEVGDLMKKLMFHGRDFQKVYKPTKEEMGDTLWYFALMCAEMGWSLEDIINENVAKLQQRDGLNMEKFHERR